MAPSKETPAKAPLMQPPAATQPRRSVWGAMRRASKAPRLDSATIAREFEREMLLKNLKHNLSGEGDDPHDVCAIEDAPFYVFKAAAKGEERTLELIGLKFPGRLDSVDEDGLAPLHHAIRCTHIAAIRVLAHFGADLNAATPDGTTGLHMAAAGGDVEAVRELLALGADPNLRNSACLAPIHVAAIQNHPGVIEEMGKHGDRVNFNIVTKTGQTALHLACKQDFSDCVQKLIEHGCKICSSCNFGFYPIHVAAKNAAHRSMEIILTASEAMGYSRGQVLSFVSSEAQSPLHAAVIGGDVGAVRACLEHGAKMDAKQEDEATAFHLAANQGLVEILDLMLIFYLKNNPDKSITDLLHARDILGLTPLHRAAMFDHPQVVQFLIDKGSDVNLVSNDGRSALLLAAEKGGAESLDILISAGACLRAKDAQHRNLVHFMIRHGAKLQAKLAGVIKKEVDLLNERDAEGCTPLHLVSRLGFLSLLETLLQLGAKSNVRDLDDQAPLHFAARFGRSKTVRRLLEFSTSSIINETDAGGRTPLHVAAENGQTGVIHLLLSQGALVHKDYSGKTPLHLAAERGCPAAVQMLLAFHPNLLDTPEKHGNSPLHVACMSDQPGVVSQLLSSGAAYTTNAEGLTPLDVVTENRATASALAIVRHERWAEVLRFKSTLYGCPLLGLIQHMPAVEKVVLDRFVTTADVDPSDDEFWINYNFVYMGPTMTEQADMKAAGTVDCNPAVLALNKMVEFGRVDLLSHPVCTKWLEMKWSVYGRAFFACGIVIYALFLLCLTHLAVKLPKGTVFMNATHTIEAPPNLKGVCPFSYWFLFVYCCLNMIKEFIQLYQQGYNYIIDPVNYDEWILYITCLGFVTPTCFWGSAGSWDCAAIAVFLAWFNFLLYFQRTPSVGLYVVMFLQIMHTVMRVALIFSTLFIGFGLTFSILFGSELRRGFDAWGLSVMQTVMMMMGDWNFQALVVRPMIGEDVPLEFPVLSLVFIVGFILLVPILFINLLIGLAVGDIDNVQKNAQLKRLAMQVEYHTQLELKLPLWFLLRVDKEEVKEFPNNRGRSVLCRVLKQIQRTSDAAAAAEIHHFKLSQAHSLTTKADEAVAEMRRLKTQLDRQDDMLRLILQKMDIHDEADDGV